ncbi:hypothetical protein FisN_9Hh087 [Fistulifera solaris]|uniref:EamA domain-containing protein n=1 Tax=Fistulifera solaris TaxID=1519565 RepID=A0A1Z5K294_FISSO|nr:hypothetical protein FisN_9Hh087 [Fistulifera solaris]|eukprot:GAX20375.1 hypothetical protein FisN_9Hh087 [Fistulifera solaris]
MRSKAAFISLCCFCTRRSLNNIPHDRFLVRSQLGMEKKMTNLNVDAPCETVEPKTHLSSLPSHETHPTSTTTTSSVLLLNVVAVIWGSQHAVIKQVMESSDASFFTLLRFGLAALLAAPFTPGVSRLWNPAIDTKEAAQTWRWGLEMGFWMFLGFSFQAIGLEYTTAQKSGFLLYLNVKFVPFLAYLLLGRTIRRSTLLSALVAFTGTALLATAGSASEGLNDLNIGDAWSVAAAMASAMFILRLEQASAQVANAAEFNAASMWVVATLSAIWTCWNAVPLDVGDALWRTATEHGWEIVYLGGVATALTNWIQSKAQKGISAERASVIYAMDPVYGAFFSSWWLGESLGGLQGWIGAGMITLAAATNALMDFPERAENAEQR